MRNRKHVLLCGMIAILVFTMASCKNPFLAKLKEKGEKKPGPQTEITYTVTFDSNGGSSVAPMTVVSGSTITLPDNPSRSGDVFEGWFTDNNIFANANAFTSSTPVTADITVYAEWAIAFANLAARLTELTGDTATAPIKVKLAPLTFANASTFPVGMFGWGEINSIVKTAGKYVILDLSECNANGNTVTGNASNISSNYMNVIYNNSHIKSIILPDSLETIGYYAFAGCSSLTGITIPNSVTSIGTWAFNNCTSLTSVTIPNSVTSIEFRAFSFCTNLTSVTFGRSGITIGGRAFPGTADVFSDTLKNRYETGGAGTYTRTAGQDNWAKQ